MSDALLPAVELPAAPCWYCSATGICRACDGRGKVNWAGHSVTPISDRCTTCGGNGKCVTCDGTGSRRRLRRQLKAPVTQAPPGLEICWSCRGERFCDACDGSGVQNSGQPCNYCYMSSGFCSVCEGAGQTHPDPDDVPPIDRGYGISGERAGLTPKWSRPLDIGEPRSISAASPGMIVVRGSTATVAYDARGELQWRVPRELVAVRALPDGRTVVRTATDVRILDPLGEILTAWSATGRQPPQPFPGDRWIDVEGTFQTRAELVCRASAAPRSGGFRWTAPRAATP